MHVVWVPAEVGVCGGGSGGAGRTDVLPLVGANILVVGGECV